MWAQSLNSKENFKQGTLRQDAEVTQIMLVLHTVTHLEEHPNSKISHERGSPKLRPDTQTTPEVVI